MKLVLQIAAGILLAVVVAAGSVAAYQYIVAQAHAKAEANARAQLHVLTLEGIKASCGQLFGEGQVAGLNGWRTLDFLGGQVTVEQREEDGAEVHWVKKINGEPVYPPLEELQVLPCLANAKNSFASSAVER